MLGRHIHMRTGALASLLYWGPAQREESAHRERVEQIIAFLRLETPGNTRPPHYPMVYASAWNWRVLWRWSPRCCCSTNPWVA
jgi:hypothetical protein